MILSKKALEAIDNMTIRMKLGLLLNKSEMTIKRYIADNDIVLTTAVVLEFIETETGLTQEEMFEKEKV